MQTMQPPSLTPTISAYDSHLLGGVGLPIGSNTREDRQILASGVFDHYQMSLGCEPKVLRHLSKLGLLQKALLERLRIGFSNRTLGLQFPPPKTFERDQIRGALENLELLLPSGSELFRGALVFPLKDESGDVVEAYGQRLTPRLRQGTPYQVYWSLRSARLFNHEALVEERDIVLCENPFQAFCLLCQGVNGAVAPSGRWCFNDIQLASLERARPDRIVMLWGDSPDAERAERLVAQALSVIDVPVQRHPLPENSRQRMPPPPVPEDVIASMLPALRSSDEVGDTLGGLLQ